MDKTQVKIYLNQLQYGITFDLVLNLLTSANLFNLEPTNGYDPQYVDLCESFFQVLHKEITYHNYAIMMTADDYDRIISNCLDKAIYLKDRYQYEIKASDLDQLSEQLIQPVSQYLSHFTTQSEDGGRVIPLINLPASEHVTICHGSDLERNFNKLRNRYPADKLHRESCRQKVIHKRPMVLPNKCYPAILEVPVAKLQANTPRVPIIGADQKPVFQKNYLDLEDQDLDHSKDRT